MKRAARGTAKAVSEADLAGPLYTYLSDLGYTVRSEVKDCDIAAVRGDELLIVEVKKTLNVQVLVQATRRQRLTDSVYVAIPRPSNKWKWWKESRGVRHLLRRLELGLILLSHHADKPGVEVVFHPLPFARRKVAKSRRELLKEISERTTDLNRAGSNRTKIVTAYRENAIRIACFLSKEGEMSPRQLRALDTGPKTFAILHDNVYGWFQRIGHGVYALSASGVAELNRFPALKAHYLKAWKRAKAGRGIISSAMLLEGGKKPRG